MLYSRIVDGSFRGWAKTTHKKINCAILHPGDCNHNVLNTADTFLCLLACTEAVPKRILDLMNVEGLTRENVASHLQVPTSA